LWTLALKPSAPGFLPFQSSTANSDAEALADGLTDDIT
jgi:TolB-like protein